MRLAAAGVAAALAVSGCTSPGERAEPSRAPLSPHAFSTVGLNLDVQGTQVYLPVTRGNGTRDFGAIAVPAKYDVMWLCLGGPAWVMVDGEQISADECSDVPLTMIRDRPAGHRTVSLRVSTDSGTAWVIAVTEGTEISQ